MRFHELIENRHDEEDDHPALLYHGTSLLSGLSILRSNKLKAKQASDIEDAGISFTTDLKIAEKFACDRDGREVVRFEMKASGRYPPRAVRWAYHNYSGRHLEKRGMVFEFSGPRLDADLEPYSHYGMEEGEWRSASDITGIEAALTAIYASPQELEEWAARLPAKAAAFNRLLSHPRLKPF